MIKYLVTGGAGFIGSNIIEKLLQKAKKVLAIDNFSTGKKENIKDFFKNPNFQFFRIDLKDQKKVEKIIGGVDFIFHQAAISSVESSISDPISTFENNVAATLNLLNIARKHKLKKIVFASSAAVYGPDPLPQKENMMPNPISPYALSKLIGEKLCQVFSKVYKIPTVCLRYFNVFGPKQNFLSDYAAVIPEFITAFLKNKRPVIFGDGKQVRDFIYIGDVVETNLKSADSNFRSGEVFNIASGKSISLLELIKILNEIFSKNVEPIFKEERPGDIKFSFADITKTKKNLSWRPKIDIREGLIKTIEWIKTNEKI